MPTQLANVKYAAARAVESSARRHAILKKPWRKRILSLRRLPRAWRTIRMWSIVGSSTMTRLLNSSKCPLPLDSP